jgi:hypothetical protein
MRVEGAATSAHAFNRLRDIALRRVAMDSDTYAFRYQGRIHAFVSWVNYDADDVLLQFTHPAAMAPWPAEHDLPSQLMTLLKRLLKLNPAAGYGPEPDLERIKLP